MKSKAIIVLIVVGILFGAVSLIEYSKNPLAWCFKDKSQCAIDAMNNLRNARDTQEKHLKQAILDNQNYYNPIINSLKPTLDGATIEAEIKAGRKENVPEGILSFRNLLIPKANAASGDVMNEISLSDNKPYTGGIRFGNAIPVGRYGEVLAELGSPYAAVPIEQYCNKEQIPVAGCDILVGIAHAESGSGTNFKCNWKTREEAIRLGQSIYFNPVGRFVGSYVNGRKVPDENGCYLEKFASWEAFWEFYTNRMANNIYEFKTRTEPHTMYLRYVKGDFTPWDKLTDDQRRDVLATPWVTINNQFTNMVKAANF